MNPESIAEEVILEDNDEDVAEKRERTILLDAKEKLSESEEDEEDEEEEEELFDEGQDVPAVLDIQGEGLPTSFASLEASS